MTLATLDVSHRIHAPRDPVFVILSRLELLPRWITVCKQSKLMGGEEGLDGALYEIVVGWGPFSDRLLFRQHDIDEEAYSFSLSRVGNEAKPISLEIKVETAGSEQSLVLVEVKFRDGAKVMGIPVSAKQFTGLVSSLTAPAVRRLADLAQGYDPLPS